MQKKSTSGAQDIIGVASLLSEVRSDFGVDQALPSKVDIRISDCIWFA
jgi:hypothetical protein